MTPLRGSVALVVGCLLLFGGAYQSFVSIDELTLALEWGVLAVLGTFPLVYGVTSLFREAEGRTRKDRGRAPGKTEYFFGRR